MRFESTLGFRVYLEGWGDLVGRLIMEGSQPARKGLGLGGGGGRKAIGEVYRIGSLPNGFAPTNYSSRYPPKPYKL